VGNHWELKVGVALHFSNTSGLAQIERGIDSLTRADTNNRLTDDLTLAIFVYITVSYSRKKYRKYVPYNCLTVSFFEYPHHNNFNDTFYRVKPISLLLIAIQKVRG